MSTYEYTVYVIYYNTHHASKHRRPVPVHSVSVGARERGHTTAHLHKTHTHDPPKTTPRSRGVCGEWQRVRGVLWVSVLCCERR